MYDKPSNSSGTHINMNYKNISNINNNWVLLEQDSDVMKGTTIIVEQSSGNIYSISTRACPDKDRWKSLIMPPFYLNNDETNTTLTDFTTVQVLDLHNSRYITELHPTIHVQLPNLRQLLLTRCDRLKLLPESICSLQFLQEVCHSRA
jgi:hypothetical protein